LTVEEQQAPEKERKESRSWRSIGWIFKVLYSPSSSFKEIVKSPSIRGSLLLLLIVCSFSVASLYVVGSKLNVLIPNSQTDAWTEPESLPLWSSNGDRGFDETDKIAGNTSFSTWILGDSTLQFNITSIGEFNSTTGGYEVLYLNLKWIHSNGTLPATATLSLISDGDNGRFELDVIENISDSGAQWTNLVVELGPDNARFIEIDSPRWENITGVDFLLAWANQAENLTAKIDALYFGKYVALANAGYFGITLATFSLMTALDFMLKWTLFAAGLWLVVRTFATDSIPFKDMFYATGYCHSGLTVFVVARLLSLLLVYPFQSLGGSQSMLGYFLQASLLVFNVWPMILGAIALQKTSDFSTKKAGLYSIAAYFVYLFVAVGFIFGPPSVYRALFALP
jgi:hypothetical protein